MPEATEVEVRAAVLGAALRKWEKELNSDLLEGFVEQVKKHYDYDLPSGFGWKANDLLVGLARQHHIKFFFSLLVRVDMTTTEMLDEFQKHLNKTIKSTALYPPSSSNHMSNLAEVARATAAAKLLDDMEWLG